MLKGWFAPLRENPTRAALDTGFWGDLFQERLVSAILHEGPTVPSFVPNHVNVTLLTDLYGNLHGKCRGRKRVLGTAVQKNDLI